MLLCVRPAAFASAPKPTRADALAYYDQPLAYVTRDVHGTPHYVVMADQGPGWEAWLCAPITEQTCADIEHLTTWDVFLHSRGPFHAYRFTRHGEMLEQHCGSRRAIPARWWALLGRER